MENIKVQVGDVYKCTAVNSLRTVTHIGINYVILQGNDVRDAHWANKLTLTSVIDVIRAGVYQKIRCSNGQSRN
jgi:hypothetical protein